MSNINEMILLNERVHEFIAYMNSFYSKPHGGVYADETNFSRDEIVEGISEYIKDEVIRRGIIQYGADTVDRERVRAIIEQKRLTTPVH